MSLSARKVNHDTCRKELGDCLPVFMASSCLLQIVHHVLYIYTQISPMWLDTTPINAYRVAAKNRTQILPTVLMISSQCTKHPPLYCTPPVYCTNIMQGDQISNPIEFLFVFMDAIYLACIL